MMGKFLGISMALLPLHRDATPQHWIQCNGNNAIKIPKNFPIIESLNFTSPHH